MSETAGGQDAATAGGDRNDPLVRIDGLSKYFQSSSGLFGPLDVDFGGDGPPVSYEREWVKAVDDVSFDIQRGETLGLVGESGCGKSTLGRTILHLLAPTEGSVYFKGRDLASLGREELRRTRREGQIIFQDPQSSLNPRMKVGRIVEEPMQAHGLYGSEEERAERARELLESVGMDPQHYNRFPHQFSGGQRQRINLARALSVDPDFVVCDEPTSALDASIQAQVLNTMRRLQTEFDLTYLFISHDLSVIRHIADRVAVMYLGKLVELGTKEEVFERPKHPYTQALLSSIPVPDPRASRERTVIQGDVPNPVDPPSGCRFRTRCPELIIPDRYDLDESAWDKLRSFVRAVDRQTFEADTEAEVRERFFDGVDLGTDAAVAVDDAVADVVAGEWERAAGTVLDAFAEPSICAREEPDYEVEAEFGDRHYAACHLYR